MNRIKVLMLSREFDWGGGVVNYIDMLSRHLSEDISTELFVIGRRKGATGFISRLFITFIDSLRLAWRLSHRDYDVVHVNPSLDRNSLIRDGIFFFVIRLFKVKKSIAFIHGWNEKESYKVQKSRVKRFLFRQTFGSASVLVVLASKFKKELAKIGCNEAKVMVATTMFDGHMLDNTARQRHDRHKRILFMARFVSEKGIFELLEAFKLLNQQQQQCELVLAGDGPVKPNVERWVEENGLSHCIKLPGYLSGQAKGQLLVDSDIFVLPTYHGEGCPVSILEAMAAGLPVISTPVGGIPDILDSGEDDVLLNDTTPSSIYTALNHLIDDDMRRKRVGRQNRKKAISNYSAPVVAGRMEKLYGQLAN